MSVVLTRPLEHVGMNGGGAQKRRSARLSQEGNGDNEPPAKKSRPNGTTTSAVSTKQQDGETKAAGRKKKQVYEEEAGDFTFTKKKKKESKAPAVRNSLDEQPAAATAPAPVIASSDGSAQPPVAEATQAPKTALKKTRKKLPMSPERDIAENTVRRSKRLSSEKEPETQASPQRPAHARSHANVDRSPSPARAVPVTVEKKRKHGSGNQVEEEKVMTISLAFADTPIIRRNREMRKASKDGHRRSSAGMRGKRASSVIDEGRGHEPSDVAFMSSSTLSHSTRCSIATPLINGRGTTSGQFANGHADTTYLDVLANDFMSNVALPHSEVPAPEFYKHISADLTEPRRMRCLLGWCGTRCLPPKPNAPETSTPATNLEFQALQAARVIQEELSLELVSNGTLSDWFSRDETSAPQIPTRKKANPRNIANANKAEELERELERLKTQRAEWDEVVQSTSSIAKSDDTQPELGGTSPLRPELLSNLQRDIFEKLTLPASNTSTDPMAIQQKLQTISNDLEFTVDMFAHGVHTLSTTRETAERVAEKSLADAARALEEREKQRAASGQSLDQMNSLRGLARVLNAQQKRT